MILEHVHESLIGYRPQEIPPLVSFNLGLPSGIEPNAKRLQSAITFSPFVTLTGALANA
jgi:hypothetical protein